MPGFKKLQPKNSKTYTIIITNVITPPLSQYGHFFQNFIIKILTHLNPRFQHYTLSFPNAAANTSHVLGFHLDPFTNIQSSITLTNIVTGWVGVRQPFSLAITTNTSNGLLMYQLTGQPANYTVQASSNFIDWTTIAILV